MKYQHNLLDILKSALLSRGSEATERLIAIVANLYGYAVQHSIADYGVDSRAIQCGCQYGAEKNDVGVHCIIPGLCKKATYGSIESMLPAQELVDNIRVSYPPREANAESLGRLKNGPSFLGVPARGDRVFAKGSRRTVAGDPSVDPPSPSCSKRPLIGRTALRLAQFTAFRSCKMPALMMPTGLSSTFFIVLIPIP